MRTNLIFLLLLACVTLNGQNTGQIITRMGDANVADHQKLISTILGELKITQEDLVWDEFEMRFQQVHTGFYANLQKVCPTLTSNEKRLSAFLHLTMSSKEISNITGQTIRSIEMARIRLRKKLNLTNSTTSLSEFLDSL